MAQRNDSSRQHQHNSSDDVEVLCSLQNNHARPQRSAEDDDLALAKALQEQERAFLRLHEGSAEEFGEENYFEGDIPDEDGPTSDLAYARRLQAEEMQHQYSRLLDMAGPRRGGQQGSEDVAHQQHGQAQDDDDDDDDEDDDEADDYDDYGQGEYMTEDEVDPDNMTFEELQALADTVGTVSRGLPAHVMDSLPISKWHRQAPTPAGGSDAGASRTATIDLCTPKGIPRRPAGVPVISIGDTPEQQIRGPSQEVQCTVCCMELEEGDDVMRLPCSHFYHPDCIRPWLALNKACPICGREVGAPLVQVLDTALRSRNH